MNEQDKRKLKAITDALNKTHEGYGSKRRECTCGEAYGKREEGAPKCQYCILGNKREG